MFRRLARLVVLSALPLAGMISPARAADDHGDDATSATPLAPAAWTAGRIESAGDLDAFRFGATAGTDYVLATRSPWPMDTTLTLVDRDGLSALAFDDDGGGGRASRIAWRAPASGSYTLVVAHYDASAGTGRYELAAGAGASGSAASGGGGASTGAAGLAIDAPAVYDPKLEDAGGLAALPIDIAAAAGADVDLTVRDAAGTHLVTLLANATIGSGGRTASWDGTDLAGVLVDPGVYRLRLEDARSGGAVERAVHVVRLGASEVALAPAAGSGDEVDYLYHKAGGAPGGFYGIFAGDPEWKLDGAATPADPGDLDRADGRPRRGPAPWANVDAPPGGPSYSVPALFTAGAAPEALLTLGARPVSEATGAATAPGYPIAGLPIRAVVNGVVATGLSTALGTGLAPGGRLRAPLGTAVAAGVDRADLAIEVRFEYEEGGAWRSIPGEQTAVVRVYTILARPDLVPPGSAPGAPYLPWLAAVDRVARWSAGAARDRAALAKLVTDQVFERSGLAYDTIAGAPAYAWGTTDDLELDLSGYLDLARGARVNCSDCATLVASLANMAGGDLEYAVLSQGFTLNYIRAIGASAFTNDPFGTGSSGGFPPSGGPGSFSFHAFATRDRGATVHDACLSVDDDRRPWEAPHLEGRPRGMGADRYRLKLSPDRTAVGTIRKPRLR